jgi:hypothetical protein
LPIVAKTVLTLWFFISLCSAPSIVAADEKKRTDCLSPPQAGEFPRAPAVATKRRVERDKGVFFCFVFYSRERK